MKAAYDVPADESKTAQMFKKRKGGNYHEYYNTYYYHCRFVNIIRRGRRLLLAQAAVGMSGADDWLWRLISDLEVFFVRVEKPPLWREECK